MKLSYRTIAWRGNIKGNVVNEKNCPIASESAAENNEQIPQGIKFIDRERNSVDEIHCRNDYQRKESSNRGKLLFRTKQFSNYVIFHWYLELHSIELKVERFRSQRSLSVPAICKRPFLNENWYNWNCFYDILNVSICCFFLISRSFLSATNRYIDSCLIYFKNI